MSRRLGMLVRSGSTLRLGEAVLVEVTRVDTLRGRAEAGATAPLPELMVALRSGGLRAVSANGVLGDPAGATAEEGDALLDALTADLVATVDALP